MKGFKTIIFGLLLAVAAPVLSYLEGLKATIGQCAVDATSNVEVCALPWWVGSLIGVAVIALRFLTTSAVFKK